MSALVIAGVVRDGDVHVTDAFYATRRQKWAKKVGDGVEIAIRIDPTDEAWRHSDAKHYYGHFVRPVSKRSGETEAEVHLRWKSHYMPDDGRTSITELSREEFKAYLEAVELDIRENEPKAWDDCMEAMALYERRSA